MVPGLGRIYTVRMLQRNAERGGHKSHGEGKCIKWKNDYGLVRTRRGDPLRAGMICISNAESLLH